MTQPHLRLCSECNRSDCTACFLKRSSFELVKLQFPQTHNYMNASLHTLHSELTPTGSFFFFFYPRCNQNRKQKRSINTSPPLLRFRRHPSSCTFLWPSKTAACRKVPSVGNTSATSDHCACGSCRAPLPVPTRRKLCTSDTRSLCSASDTRIFRVPRMGRRTLEERSFQYIGPVIWNSLPLFLVRYLSSLSSFKSKLKTHIFSSAY